MGRRLGDWLAGYLTYTQALEAPEFIHYWVGVSTIASALQRKVHIDQKQFKWYPNFYILIVGPPGIVNKTTSVNAGEALLKKLPNVMFSPSSLSWQWMHQELSESVQVFHDQLGQPRAQTPLTCSIGELSKFIDWDDPKMISWLLEAYDCPDEDIRGLKSTGKQEVLNLYVNLIGAITPVDLRESMGKVAKEGGFFSRCTVLYADRKRHRQAYLDEVALPTAAEQSYLDLIHDLGEINTLSGVFIITKTARELGRQWYDYLCDQMVEEIKSGNSTSQLARQQTIVHKLAMVLAVSRGNTLEITREVLEESIMRVEAISTFTKKALGFSGASLEHQNAQRIIEAVKEKGLTDERTLWAIVARHMSRKEFEQALEHAFQSRRLIRAKLERQTLYGYPED